MHKQAAALQPENESYVTALAEVNQALEQQNVQVCLSLDVLWRAPHVLWHLARPSSRTTRTRGSGLWCTAVQSGHHEHGVCRRALRFC
jgi:hypothetical protein